MMLFRFSPEKYSDDLSGEGARRRGGRWNSRSFPVVYTSMTISLSLLELFVYATGYEEIKNNYLMRIDVPAHFTKDIPAIKVKEQWQTDIAYSRFIGDSFLNARSSLLLKVPSAIIPEESNILINPVHPDIKKIKIISAALFRFDSRLFK